MIDKISLGFKGITPIHGTEPSLEPSKIEGGTSKASFGDMFQNAIKEVDTLQKTADDQIEGMTVGRPDVTPHGAMLALEKADVAFQLMSTIRAKIVSAYQEVLRTQI